MSISPLDGVVCCIGLAAVIWIVARNYLHGNAIDASWDKVIELSCTVSEVWDRYEGAYRPAEIRRLCDEARKASEDLHARAVRLSNTVTLREARKIQAEATGWITRLTACQPGEPSVGELKTRRDELCEELDARREKHRDTLVREMGELRDERVELARQIERIDDCLVQKGMDLENFQQIPVPDVERELAILQGLLREPE